MLVLVAGDWAQGL